MAVQLLLCGVLPPGLVQYCLQTSGVVVVKIFLYSSRRRRLAFTFSRDLAAGATRVAGGGQVKKPG